MDNTIVTSVIVLVLTLTAGLVHCDGDGGEEWSYEETKGKSLGPSDWGYNYSKCAGSVQSPISINTANATTRTSSLTFYSYNTSMSNNFTMLENGHTVVVVMNGNTTAVVNSHLNGKYILEQFHFHWGPNDTSGSEHNIDDKHYPLEIHFVHYNSDKYLNVVDALTNSGNDSAALMAIGIVIDVATTANGGVVSDRLNSLSDWLIKIPNEGDSVSILPFPIADLLPCSQATVYTYSGSLTTPPCVETVNWNVFDQPLYLTSDQMAKFRKLHKDNTTTMEHNSRPIQPLNGRTVQKYTVPPSCTNPPPLVGAPTSTTPNTMSSTTEKDGGDGQSSTTRRNGADNAFSAAGGMQQLAVMLMMLVVSSLSVFVGAM